MIRYKRSVISRRRRQTYYLVHTNTRNRVKNIIARKIVMEFVPKLVNNKEVKWSREMYSAKDVRFIFVDHVDIEVFFTINRK